MTADPGEAVRLRVDLAYDGSGFHGFARQRGVRTVQGVLEEALERLAGVAVTTTGAGRTDAGVHALAQVVTCDVPAGSRLRLGDPERLRRALDHLCGPEIAVWSVRAVTSGFDARFSAQRRHYRYRLYDAEAMNPLWRHDTWHLGPPSLDTAAMGAGGRHLVGEHDFSSFCRRAGDKPLVRRVERLEVRRDHAGLVIAEVVGAAFCHQMVRSIVGCLVPVGQGRRRADQVRDIRDARDRQMVGAIAPPHGLTLIAVDYP
ncbi:MAG: tRNA pseudouridine(38-40) synthase TruA [Nitriliruptorales bacterium]|nr:tRNA pseudouridine(38-40) synthase TruA [Nitriliruptorales bacterium]